MEKELLRVFDAEKMSLWWASKEFTKDKKLCDYVGKNEKTKIVVKVQRVKLPRFYEKLKYP